MPYRLDLDRPVGDAIARVARECLDDAEARLAALAEGRGDTARHVHETRKRCKELRGLVRLVAPAVGDRRARRADRAVRDAARLLSGLRDDHVLETTLERLTAAGFAAAEVQPASTADDADGPGSVPGFVAGHDGTMDVAERSVAEAAGRAADLLGVARRRILGWDLGDDVDACCAGLAQTHRAGRRALEDFRAEQDDLAEHEWRKDVKYLWYQMRLLRDVDPAMTEPLIARLDDLGEALGDDHDLAVLVAGRGGDDPVVAAARAAQSELRRRSVVAGMRIYAERSSRFADRIRAQWMLTREIVDESPVGGLTMLASRPDPQAARADPGERIRAHDATGPVERERRFVVTGETPDLAARPVTRMRQGYLALDRGVSVRVRDTDRDPPRLTVKAGAGAVRTEVECELAAGDFEALWPLTDGRRIDKARHDVPLDDGRIATVDVFGGILSGLVLVEVEFDDDESLEGFVAPAWFGVEVTDDARFTNAALSTADSVPEPPGSPS